MTATSLRVNAEKILTFIRVHLTFFIFFVFCYTKVGKMVVQSGELDADLINLNN